MKEVWVDALNFEGYYQVSNLGRVKRLKRQSKNSRGNSLRTLPEKILSLTNRNLKIYITVKLTVKGVTKSVQLHRLVLCSFETEPVGGREVNHINGNKRDNSLANLEWVTRQENVNHAIKLKLRTKIFGEQTNSNKMTSSTVKKIWKLRNKGFSYVKISEKLNVSQKMVGDVVRGRTWNHILKG